MKFELKTHCFNKFERVSLKSMNFNFILNTLFIAPEVKFNLGGIRLLLLSLIVAT